MICVVPFWSKKIFLFPHKGCKVTSQLSMRSDLVMGFCLSQAPCKNMKEAISISSIANNPAIRRSQRRTWSDFLIFLLSSRASFSIGIVSILGIFDIFAIWSWWDLRAVLNLLGLCEVFGKGWEIYLIIRLKMKLSGCAEFFDLRLHPPGANCFGHCQIKEIPVLVFQLPLDNFLTISALGQESPSCAAFASGLFLNLNFCEAMSLDEILNIIKVSKCREVFNDPLGNSWGCFGGANLMPSRCRPLSRPFQCLLQSCIAVRIRASFQLHPKETT